MPCGQNDNNPVEVRVSQIQGSPLRAALGGPPTTKICTSPYDWLQAWVYYPNGIVVSSRNTCAHVLYGPIYSHWKGTGGLWSYLGFPSTDITDLSNGASFAAFENGVLYRDAQDHVSELVPVSPDLIRNSSGIDTSAQGITAVAAAQVQALAANALATNQNLRNEVESISTQVSFIGTGWGGCAGASFHAAGTTLLRSHLFRIHADFDLKGCAGTFGGAWADVRAEIRIVPTRPSPSARFVNYWIDAVGSPFGAGDNDIRSALTGLFNGQFGRDLLAGVFTLPSGVTVLAILVDSGGNLRIYLQPMCGFSQILSTSGSSRSSITLERIQTFRHRFLEGDPNRMALVSLVEAYSSSVVGEIAAKPDGRQLVDLGAELLACAFVDKPDHEEVARRIERPTALLEQLVGEISRKEDPAPLQRKVLDDAVTFTQESAKAGLSLEDAIARAEAFLERQLQAISARPDRKPHGEAGGRSGSPEEPGRPGEQPPPPDSKRGSGPGRA
jgi:hypothetical protein